MNRNPSLLLVVLGFAAIYIIWGSTYLAIAYAIDSIPPFLMAGSRFFVAGLLLFAWTRIKGVPLPTWKEIKACGISGILMLMGGNMSVVWAEQYIPSSIAATVIATVPMVMVAIDRTQWRNLFTNPFLGPGLLVGFFGVFYLIGFDKTILTQHPVNGIIGFALLIFATITWAFGTLLSRKPDHPENTNMRSALQMLVSGSITMFVGFGIGEGSQLEVSSITTESITALIYLITFGTIIAYSSYIWLVQVRPPALVGTYAYVNPIVAVFLGWFMRNEPVTGQTIMALLIILAGVFMVNFAFSYRKKTVGSLES